MNQHDDLILDEDEEPLCRPVNWWQRTISLRQWHCFCGDKKKYCWTINVSNRHYRKAAQVYEYLLRDIRRSSRAKAGMPCGVDVWLDDKQIEPVIRHGRMHVGPHGRLV